MVSGSERVTTTAHASHTSPTRYTQRHDDSDKPASGSAATAEPAPIPLAMASTLSAHARASDPISSVANTMMNTLRARPSGRPMVCVATRNSKFGATAPREVMSGASHAVMMIILRRPKRSAESAKGSAITTPQRTIAAAKPWPLAETSNSLAAKATVCVNTVFTNAAGSEANNSSTITRRRCASRLLGTVKPNIERTSRASRAAVTTARAY